MHITSREILIEEFLKPKGICLTQFAVDTGLTLEDVDLMKGKTPEVLAVYTKMSVGFWKNLPLNSKTYDRALVQLVEMISLPPEFKDWNYIKRLIAHIERYELAEYPTEPNEALKKAKITSKKLLKRRND